MGREDALGGSGRGGKNISAFHATRVRVRLGAVAILVVLALAVCPALFAEAARGLVAAAAAVAVAAAAAALVRFPWATGAALFLLAAEYIVVQVTRGLGLTGLLLYPAGLVLLGELLFFASELKRVQIIESVVLVCRLLAIGAVTCAAAFVALLVGAVSNLAPLAAVAGAMVGTVGATVAFLLALFRIKARAVSGSSGGSPE
ncbi:MAG: hypothetical protein N3B14_07495 [Thermoleophilia bacterium]|nr:hypothetical protein [Thermoleophilia bacterium]